VRFCSPKGRSCFHCKRSVAIGSAAFPPELSYIGRQFRCRCGDPEDGDEEKAAEVTVACLKHIREGLEDMATGS